MPPTLQAEATVTENRRVAPGVTLLRLHAPEVAERAQPGQFLLARCSDGNDPLLRRPFPFFAITSPDIAILVHAEEPGRRWLAGRSPGQPVDILGPLGQGFALARDTRHLLLVAEGLAIAGLAGLALHTVRAGLEVTMLGGFAGAAGALPADLLPPEVEYRVATADGSLGQRGAVANLLACGHPVGRPGVRRRLTRPLSLPGRRHCPPPPAGGPGLRPGVAAGAGGLRHGGLPVLHRGDAPGRRGQLPGGAGVPSAGGGEPIDTRRQTGPTRPRPGSRQSPHRRSGDHRLRSRGGQGFAPGTAGGHCHQHHHPAPPPRRAQPRLVETPAGMILATGFQNPGLRTVLQRHAAAWQRLPIPVILSIAGEDVASLRECIELADASEGVSAVQLEPDLLRPDVDMVRVVDALRNLTSLPLLVHLGGGPSATVADTVVDLAAVGADAVVVGSPWPGLVMDAATGRPALLGGVVGPAIRPLALRLVYEVVRILGPEGPSLIAAGGISSPEDVAAFLAAGAAAVQLDTVVYSDPAAVLAMILERL